MAIGLQCRQRRYTSGAQRHIGIYVENFSAEEASKRVPVVMYLVACLLKNVPFEKDIDSAAYLGAGFISDELKALKSLRKVAPAGYACAVKADRLLNE